MINYRFCIFPPTYFEFETSAEVFYYSVATSKTKEPTFSHVCYLVHMLRNTLWVDWSLTTITKGVQCLWGICILGVPFLIKRAFPMVWRGANLLLISILRSRCSGDVFFCQNLQASRYRYKSASSRLQWTWCQKLVTFYTILI